MEVAREMIHDQYLPVHLWAEAARTTMQVQNHTPQRVLKNKTHEEVFSGKKQERHLRIFGCPVYIHIPKEKRTKLDTLGKKGIFVGYYESSKDYRIYFPGFKKIDISRDVTFDEDTTYNKSRNKPTEEFEEPQRHVDPPPDKNPHKRKPTWVREVIQGAERYGAPE